MVDFGAAWCGPCQKIAPFFAELAGRYPSARFVKVDVDDVEEAAAEAGVTALPSFQVYRHGRREFELSGADESRLEAVVRRAVAFLAYSKRKAVEGGSVMASWAV